MFPVAADRLDFVFPSVEVLLPLQAVFIHLAFGRCERLRSAPGNAFSALATAVTSQATDMERTRASPAFSNRALSWAAQALTELIGLGRKS